MWYRSVTLALVGSMLMLQPGWAQPGGKGPGGPGGAGGRQGPGPGGRNQEETIRRLEREVAEMKSEIRKLQTANRSSTDRRGGPPAFQSRPGGPRGFGAAPGVMGFRGGFGGPGARGFQGPQFGPPRGYRGNVRGGFGYGQFQSPRFYQRGFGQPRGFEGRGFQRGPGRMQRFGPPPREDFRGPEQRNRRDGVEQRRDDRGRPSEARPGENRPNQDRRPPRPPAA